MSPAVTFFHTATFNTHTSTQYMVSLSLANPSVSECGRLTPQFCLITNYSHRFLLTLLTIKVYSVKVQ
jgi:hypothetical protein